MRTSTACCASTFRRGPTSTHGPPTTSITSLRSSMIVPVFASPTRHRTKPCNDGHVNRHDDDSQRSLETAIGIPTRYSKQGTDNGDGHSLNGECDAESNLQGPAPACRLFPRPLSHESPLAAGRSAPSPECARASETALA